MTLRLPIPAAENMIYVIIRSQNVMTITDIESFPLPPTERIRTLFRKSQECVMELICEKPTYSFKHLAVFLEKLLSTTDRITPILVFAVSANRIFVTTP